MKAGRDFFSYQSFIATNPGSTSFDYLHGLASQIGLSPEDFNAISMVLAPELIEVDDLVFVKELFYENKYRNILEKGYRGEEIQYWMNLLDITSLFEGLPVARLSKTTEAIIAGWHAKLVHTFPHKKFAVKRIVDVKAGELAITFHDLSTDE